MKKNYLLILVIVVTNSCFGQTYRPMLSNSSEWCYYYRNLDQTSSHKYTFRGDTTISSTKYKMFDLRIIDTDLNSLPITYYEIDYLREDSINKKVYSISNNQETLIYDFNLLPGDTFRSYSSATEYIILDSISNDYNALIPEKWEQSCLLQPNSNFTTITNPKIFYFYNDFTNSDVIWIEGIGSLNKLTRAYSDFGCFSFLSCHFDQNGSKDFGISTNANTSQMDCPILTGINTLNPANESFIIQNNPSNGNAVSIIGTKFLKLDILNIKGQNIKTILPVNEKTTINLQDQPQGIYFVQAQFKNGDIATKKLILTR